MAKRICELCQQNPSADLRFGVSLCKDCIDGYNKAFSGDPAAISYFSDPQNFPYASDSARLNIIQTVSSVKPRTPIAPNPNTPSATNSFVKPVKTPSAPVAYKQPANTGGLLDGLYENIGKKIKDWAKWIFVLEAIAAVISGLALLFDGGDGWLIGLLLILAGPLVALVSTWLLYGFGELIVKTSANERNTQDILNLMKQNNKND